MILDKVCRNDNGILLNKSAGHNVLSVCCKNKKKLLKLLHLRQNLLAPSGLSARPNQVSGGWARQQALQNATTARV